MPPLAIRVYDLYFHSMPEEFQPPDHVSLSSAFTSCSAATRFSSARCNAADAVSSRKGNLQPGVTR